MREEEVVAVGLLVPGVGLMDAVVELINRDHLPRVEAPPLVAQLPEDRPQLAYRVAALFAVALLALDQHGGGEATQNLGAGREDLAFRALGIALDEINTIESLLAHDRIEREARHLDIADGHATGTIEFADGCAVRWPLAGDVQRDASHARTHGTVHDADVTRRGVERLEPAGELGLGFDGNKAAVGACPAAHPVGVSAFVCADVEHGAAGAQGAPDGLELGRVMAVAVAVGALDEPELLDHAQV